MAGNEISFVARLKDEVSGKLAKIRDEFDRVGASKGAQTLLQGLGMGAGLAAFTSIQGAIQGVIGVAQDAIKNASDLRESMALSQQVFVDNADEIDAWASTASTAFGMTKKEALDTAAQFGNAFKNVGVSIDETAEKSQILSRLAADLGSAFNQSSQQAANALRAGLLGEAEPMRRFGVFLDSAAVEAKLLAQGIEKVGGEFTIGQKVMARYQLIMEQTKETQGMFGRDAGSLADAQKSLNAQLTDLSATVGEELLPVMVELTKFAKDEVVPTLLDVVKTAKENKWVFDLLADAFAVAGADGRHFVNEYKEAQAAIEAGTDASRDHVRELNIVRANLRDVAEAGREAGSAARGAAGGFGEMGDEADDAADEVDKLEDKVSALMDTMLEAALGPKELRLEWEKAKDELKEDQKEAEKLDKKIAKFKDLGKPVGELEDSLRDMKLEILDDKKRVGELAGKLYATGQISWSELLERLRKAGVRLDYTGDEARELYGWLNKIAGTEVWKVTEGKWKGKYVPAEGAASGGYRPAGWQGAIGEAGQEHMVLLPGGGALIAPNQGGGGGGGGGGAPVTLTVNLDGRTIAEVVDRHLYYAAAAAPQSATV